MNSFNIQANKTGLLLFILFLASLIGAVYFTIYNTSANTGLVDFFYIATVVCFIVAMVHGKKNIKKQLAQGYSAENRKKTFLAFIFLVAGGLIINFISKYIGGPKGFTVGIILAAILVFGLFHFFKNTSKNDMG